jgi:membrane-bound serine protease (ClpP class)
VLLDASGAGAQSQQQAPQQQESEDRTSRHVDVVQVSGWIDPVVVDFLGDAIVASDRGGAEALVVQLDSPGSVVSEDRLQSLVLRISHARLPIAVWVGGSGARAYGGAARLVTAAPLAGMAPGARIGRLGDSHADRADHDDEERATPAELRAESLGPGRAFELGIVQLNEEESAVLGSFIAALDGKEAAGRTLRTAEFTEREGGPPEAALTVQARLAKLDLVPRMMHTVASPPVAYLLLVFGLALLVFELFTAGVGIAGGVGAAALVLASYGLAILPTSWLGLALVVLSMFGFAVDVQTGVPRLWTGVGVVALVVGSLLLYDDPVGLGWLPLLAGVVGVVLLMLAGLPATVRSRFSTPTIGREAMIGELGEAVADLRPAGVVRVRDALWPARTNRATPIAAGDPVRVVGIEGAQLEVAPAEESASRTI